MMWDFGQIVQTCHSDVGIFFIVNGMSYGSTDKPHSQNIAISPHSIIVHSFIHRKENINAAIWK